MSNQTSEVCEICGDDYEEPWKPNPKHLLCPDHAPRYHNHPTTIYHYHGGPWSDRIDELPTTSGISDDRLRYEEKPPAKVWVSSSATDEINEDYYRTDGRCCQRKHDAGWWTSSEVGAR